MLMSLDGIMLRISFIFTESKNTFFTSVLSAGKLLLLLDVVSDRDPWCRWNMWFDHYLFKTLWISFYLDDSVENSWDSYFECTRGSFHVITTFTLTKLFFFRISLSTSYIRTYLPDGIHHIDITDMILISWLAFALHFRKLKRSKKSR